MKSQTLDQHPASVDVTQPSQGWQPLIRVFLIGNSLDRHLCFESQQKNREKNFRGFFLDQVWRQKYYALIAFMRVFKRETLRLAGFL